MMKKLGKSLAVMAIAASAFLLTGCGTTTIDLNQYVELKVEGYSGEASAYADVDDDALENAIVEALDIKTNEEDVDDIESLGLAFLEMEKVYDVKNCYEVYASPEEGLKNGDTVTISADIDEEKLKEYDIKFKFETVEEKVKGLPEYTVISEEELFKDLVVEFVGTAPNAELQIRNTSKNEVIKDIEYYSEQKGENLDVGDKVFVTATDEDDLKDKGYVLEAASKEYTVEKVDRYIKSFDELTDEALEKIMKQASDMVEAQLECKKLDNNFYKGEDVVGYMDQCDSINKVKLETSYFYTLKDGFEAEDSDETNLLGITYKFNVKNIYRSYFGEHGDYKNCYIMLWLTDIIIDKEGELQFDIDTMRFSSGYASFDTFYKYRITSNKDKYEIVEVDLSSYQ